MPVTPFHFGPGLLCKSAAPGHISLSTFALTDVLVDLETAYNLYAGNWPVHGVLHTLPGSLAVGIGTAAMTVAVRPAARAVFDLVDRQLGIPPAWIRGELSLTGAVSGGILGGLGSCLLDALMHSDVRPLWPMLPSNPLFGLISTSTLHAMCVVTGVIGLAVLLAKRAAMRRTG